MIWVEVQTLFEERETSDATRLLPPGAKPIAGLTGPIGSVIQTAGDDIKTCIKKVADVVSEAVEQGGPQSWTVEFAIGFKGSAAIPVIASGEATANLKVTLAWKRN